MPQTFIESGDEPDGIDTCNAVAVNREARLRYSLATPNVNVRSQYRRGGTRAELAPILAAASRLYTASGRADSPAPVHAAGEWKYQSTVLPADLHCSRVIGDTV